MKDKTRLDSLLFERGHFDSREAAKRAVMAGEIHVEGYGESVKPSTMISSNCSITVLGKQPYVSRGAEKLLKALEQWNIDVNGLHVLDVGASTGGFTDCLLQRGATAVTALDVGRGQLHWKLRNDSRVTVMEGFNARFLKPDDLSRVPEAAVVDVSFISLKIVMPPVSASIKKEGWIIALIKPQFEAGKGEVGKGGVLRGKNKHKQVLNHLIESFEADGISTEKIIPSPIKGASGNIEYLALCRSVESAESMKLSVAEIIAETERIHGGF